MRRCRSPVPLALVLLVAGGAIRVAAQDDPCDFDNSRERGVLAALAQSYGGSPWVDPTDCHRLGLSWGPEDARRTILILQDEKARLREYFDDHENFERDEWERFQSTTFAGFPARLKSGWTQELTEDGKVYRRVDKAGIAIVLLPEHLLAVWVRDDAAPSVTHNGEQAQQIADAVLATMRAHRLLPGAVAVERDVSLVASLTASSGGVVSGARLRLQVPGSMGTVEVETDGFGAAKRGLRIPEDDKGGVLLEAIVLGRGTRYEGRPSRLLQDLVVPVGKRFPVTFAGIPVCTVEHALALRPLFVSLRCPGCPAPASALVTVRQDQPDGRSMAGIPDEAFVAAGGQPVSLLLPARELLGLETVQVVATRVIQGSPNLAANEAVQVPGRADTSAAVILELVPEDLATQFAGRRARLAAFLEAAGHGPDAVKRILAVRLVPSDRAGIRYDDGTIAYAAGSLLGGAGENLCHELGHAIIDVTAPDDPPGVGGTHDVGEAIPPEAAWDEGRAHLFGWMMTRELGLPSAPPPALDPAGVTDAARRELYVGQALIELYGNRATYPDPRVAAADLRAVHAEAVRTLGRPPRTVAEFVAVKQGLDGPGTPRRQDLDRIAARFGFQTGPGP